jgi:hypothetical protein
MTIFNEFFVNLFQEYAFDRVADNGKRLCEGGAKKAETFY